MDDAGEIHALGGSLRREASSARSGDAAVFFSRSSSRDEDDEEALRWAALEKLPTYDRARTAVLAMPEGELREVNVQRLGPQERHALLQRLAWVGDDHARFLSKFKDRVDRVGIELPTIEVRYENLNVEAEAYVGSRGLPTILNTYANVLEGLANTLHITPNRKQKISILHNVSGIIKPHRMTLLLGPPGAGKTTLLLALAGNVPSGLKVSGQITYNGHTMDEFEPRRSAAYVSQHDLHMGELTVRETVNFSAKCQGIGHRYDLLMELSRREKEENIKPDPEVDIYLKAAATGEQKAEVVTNHILKVLGLDICADTIVGNNMLRGISGGQKKRVTTAEMIVTPGRALFMDEISTGLDSSTTYNIVDSIRQTIHIVGGTAVIALLQPAPETYELFDDIILLSDGQVVYNGPREHVLEFFESVGFKCPERKGVQNSSSVQPVVSVERTVFYRERAAHMYSPLPYALGQVAIELPYILVQSLIYGVLVYAMIGFEWTAAKFFWYLFFMYFTLSYYTFYGMMSVGLTPSYNVASVVSTAFYAIWNLFSGFIIPRTRIPIWWRWYYWVCPVAWTLYGLVTSQFGDVTDTFDNGVRISDFVESYFGYHRDFLWVVAVMVVSFAVLFAFLFGLSIKIFNFQKR
nr:PDR-type ABC transporter-like [Oryza sativa Japonica Group]BAD29206.1 PDR-type ABC transporter-like [Oryza sativa Japonica Group]